MHFRDPESLRHDAERLFARERDRIGVVLPQAVIEHIGATSIPGAWSKGDVDLLVRVGDFAGALAALRALYAEHQRENWTSTFASFALPDEAVGVQLVARNGVEEREFLEFRDRLRGDPRLLAEYNELKRRHEGADEDTYRAAKTTFVLRVLGYAEITSP